MPQAERTAILGIYDRPLWRDWIAWLTGFALLSGITGAFDDFPDGVRGNESALLIGLGLRAAFQFFLFGLVPGRIRRAIRTRRVSESVQGSTHAPSPQADVPLSEIVPPSAKSRARPWALVAFIGIPLAALIGYGALMPDSPSEAERALGAKGRLSAHDEDAMGRLSALVQGWNTAAEPFTRDYIDPNVSAERWVREATGHIRGMQSSVEDLRAMIFSIQDAGLRQALLPFVDARQEQFGAVVDLHNSVARGDSAGEDAALKRLQDATSRGQELVLSLLDRIRPFLDPDDLEDALRRGSTPSR